MGVAKSSSCVILGPNQAISFDSKFVHYPMLASCKYDGWRMHIKQGELLSRTGKPIRNKYLPNKLKEIMRKSMLDGIVYDGELWGPLPFNELQSLFSSFDNPLPDFIKFHVFDMLSYEEWEKRSEPIFKSRYERYWSKLTNDPLENVIPVYQRPVINADDARQVYSEYLADGFEGIILRSPYGKYKHGRCTLNEGNLFKFKEYVTADAMIVGFEQGTRMKDEVRTGERTRDVRGFLERTHKQDDYILENRIGSFIVSLEDGTTVGVGLARGMKEVAEARGLNWENREQFIGTWCEIRYMRVGAKDKPRLGGITRFRDDLDGMTIEQKRTGCQPGQMMP